MSTRRRVRETSEHVVRAGQLNVNAFKRHRNMSLSKVKLISTIKSETILSFIKNGQAKIVQSGLKKKKKKNLFSCLIERTNNQYATEVVWTTSDVFWQSVTTCWFEKASGWQISQILTSTQKIKKNKISSCQRHCHVTMRLTSRWPPVGTRNNKNKYKSTRNKITRTKCESGTTFNGRVNLRISNWDQQKNIIIIKMSQIDDHK